MDNDRLKALMKEAIREVREEEKAAARVRLAASLKEMNERKAREFQELVVELTTQEASG
jgi:hypothetical protein